MMAGAHQVSRDGGMNKGLACSNNQDQNKHEEVGDAAAGERQGLSEEEESKINETVGDLNNNQIADAARPAQQSGGPQKQQQPQQPPPGPIIRWERFLPVRTLKVLLVENDDCTRQVVSALLRNCSYEVTAVANGLQAWKILKDLTNDIDLVLTEVVMPGLTGIDLLSQIMSHKTCKNTPVIMMSSNDSMGTVFKCLSKGAVDFLLKPIRKNELKNLWQHVWRRCHSSSGSGSESGIQTQKSVKSKSCDYSDNSSDSNDDENRSMGLNARDGSDNGSGTQSSWTKRAAEVDSPQPMSSSDRLADPPDSTCAQVIHSAPETLCKDQVPISATRENHGKRELADDCMGKDLEIGVCRSSEYGTHPSDQDRTKLTDTKVDDLSEKETKNEGCLGSLPNNAFDESSAQAANQITAIANSSDTQVARAIQRPSSFSKISEGQDKASKDLPSLELSLKRLRSIRESGTATQDDRNVLRRSDLSAFSRCSYVKMLLFVMQLRRFCSKCSNIIICYVSLEDLVLTASYCARYHTSAASNQAPTGCGGSCSPLDNSSEAIKTESNVVSGSNVPPLKHGSNESSNNNDMGSTTKNVFTKPATNKEKSLSAPIIKCKQTSAFHPVQFRASESQEPVQDTGENVTAASSTGQSREIQHQVLAQHHHHHHYHLHHDHQVHHQVHHHVHNVKQHKPQLPHNHTNLSFKSKSGAPPQCGSSNVFNGPFEGNAANHSINGSNSGSFHGSNGQNGSSTAVQTGGLNMESANGNAEQSGPGSGSGNSSGTDQNRLAQREAALKKFRQKRKERNFGKKVRYQSRKRLAEQRPRVRGQFVRQSMHEQTSGDADR
ncbi:two-component response regulator-like PRR73 isoform X1 [Canna indica]|uniref:Two-component response regulator-like PRR73 isoform X1 n=1 Tax=Canna indica TaxID=4628 RepID=A0AAQ3KCG7_9LILI|nr:two-component response regulator-like PRR73 isoform X1 [Canna indica]